MTCDVPDEKLFAGFVEGNQTMLETLVHRYEKPLYAFLYRMTGNAADAEDAFQETFVRVVQKKASYSGRGTWKSWLYAIALNVGRSGLRRAARKRIAVPLEKEPVSPPPSDEVEREDERRRVASAVRKLPQPQREVVVLKVYEDMSFPEIAATLERPVGTVKSQMRYALQRLRNEL